MEDGCIKTNISKDTKTKRTKNVHTLMQCTYPYTYTYIHTRKDINRNWKNATRKACKEKKL